MKYLNSTALLVGLSYIEALLREDELKQEMINSAYSNEELVIALSHASVALAAISSIHDPSGSNILDIIEKARLTATRSM